MNGGGAEEEQAMKRIGIVAVLLWLAAAAEPAIADSGGAGVAAGHAYKRFGQYVTWSK